MGQKLSNSWSMIKASGKVLKSDKELVIFPIISSIGVLAVTAAFIIPLIINEAAERIATSFSVSFILIIFLYYLLVYIVIIFSNAALVGAALVRLKGGNPTVADGIRIAMSHFSSILGYAFISATIGILLNWARERLGILGKIFTFLANLTWNLITFLVIPILVVEGIGPVEAIKRSAHLLKKTWGEQLIGNIGIGMFFGLVMLALFILFIPVIILSARADQTAIAVTAGIVLGISFILLLVISTTLNAIYTAALYLFASGGSVNEAFDERILRESFLQK